MRVAIWVEGSVRGALQIPISGLPEIGAQTRAQVGQTRLGDRSSLWRSRASGAPLRASLAASCKLRFARAPRGTASGTRASACLFALAAELLELGEHRVDVELVGSASSSSGSGSRGRMRWSRRPAAAWRPAPRRRPASPWRRAALRDRDRSASTGRASPDPSAAGSARSSGCGRGSPAMVDLVVPTSRMICASLSSGWLRTSQRMAFGRSWRRDTGV